MKAKVELCLLIALGVMMRWGREVAGGLALAVLGWMLYVIVWALAGCAW